MGEFIKDGHNDGRSPLTTRRGFLVRAKEIAPVLPFAVAAIGCEADKRIRVRTYALEG